MENKIEKLIRLGLGDPMAFEVESNKLAVAVKKDENLARQVEKEFYDGLTIRGQEIKDLSIRAQLEGISDILNFSYIAKHYFGKSRQWLMQRVNGYKVNGDKAKFTPEQIATLNNAIRDIGKRIGSVSVLF